MLLLKKKQTNNVLFVFLPPSPLVERDIQKGASSVDVAHLILVIYFFLIMLKIHF